MRWNSISASCFGLLLSLVPLSVGCGRDVEVGQLGPGEGGSGGGDGGEGGGGAGGVDPGGAQIHIHFRANTQPFSHADGLSGQTPLSHVSGLKKFELLTDDSDPEPLLVFDYGQEFVEVSYDDGADTVAYSLPAHALPIETYTVARVVHSHVRYRIEATMHNLGLHLPGEFDNLQVLSDDTLIDGELRQAGYYEYEFSTAGQTFPTSGENAPVPEWSETGGFSVKFEDGEWAYYFPVFLPLTPDVPEDVDVVLEVNMFESFRWQDQELPDYAPGVFDTTATSFEPVLRFGANSFQVFTE